VKLEVMTRGNSEKEPRHYNCERRSDDDQQREKK